MKAALSTFKGFPSEGMAFLRELKNNNNREWFAPRLESYKELVRAPMLDLVQALHAAMLRFAPAYVGEPAKCLYRVYRDTRFSKDKTPYKTRADALFWRNNLDKNSGGGFYVAISPEEVGVGGGLYMASPASLLAVRQHIAANATLFRATFESKTVRGLMGELKGERTTRVPKGFAADDPAAELLKRKNYLLYAALAPDIVTTPRLFREIVTRLEAMTPFVDFLDKPLLKGAPVRVPRHQLQ
jgi:uncharacterized protein (TIGR02453 family)